MGQEVLGVIRLVVSDMDGTLLNGQGGISEGNRKAIGRLEENGIEFAIASGRDYKGVYSILEKYDLRCEAILGNGSQYVDRDGKILMSCYMNKAIVKDVIKVFEDRGTPYMIFATDGFYTGMDPLFVRDAFLERSNKKFGKRRTKAQMEERMKHMPCNYLQKIEDFDEFLARDAEILKVEAFSLETEEIREARCDLERIPGISYLSSFNDNLEVTDQEAQKGYILEKVIVEKGMLPEEVMVVGDGMNDISMFQRFTHSYAPANAETEIKELAEEVVCGSEEDGFAQAVDRMLAMQGV